MPGSDADRRNMYVLLNLPVDVGADLLRYTYEQHVADAARSQDHRRLLRLSRAFDALPRSMRLAMYPKTWSGPVAVQTDPLIAVPRSARRARPQRRARPRAAQPRSALHQPVSRGMVVGTFVFVVLFAAAQFARATHFFGSHSEPQAAAAAPKPESVDVQAIALDLNRQQSRDDIVCRQSFVTSTDLTCRASDGMTWSVSVTIPPDRYTASITQGSTYEQSARFDVWSVAQAVRQCLSQFGALPPSATGQGGQAQFRCGRGTMTVYLRPGNHLDYQRTAPHRFIVRVTAADGSIVAYRSAVDTFSPARCARPAC